MRDAWMYQRVLILVSLLGFSPVAQAEDPAKMARLCVLSAAVSPVKIDGRAWDGPSWNKDNARGASGRSVITALVAKSAAAIADLDPAIALSSMAAKAGLESYAAGTKAPDVRVRITLGDEVLIQTKAVKDSLGPSYSREHDHCSKPLFLGELSTKELRVIVVDQDLRDHDMIGSAFRPKGLTTDELSARVVQIAQPGFLVRLGFLKTDAHLKESWKVRASRDVLVKAGTILTQDFEIKGPTKLMIQWSSRGVSKGLRRAMDGTLISSWLSDPRNKDVAGTRTQKQDRHHWVGIVRDMGTYRFNLSNKGIMRMSSRRVEFEVRQQPIN